MARKRQTPAEVLPRVQISSVEVAEPEQAVPVNSFGFTPEAEKTFVAEARSRRTAAFDVDAEDRELAERDVDFIGGNQWDEKAAAIRKLFDMPVLTWNRVHKFADQVCNEGRKMNGAINVVAGDGGKPQTAQLIASRIRQIEYESQANIAYDTSREHQVGCGRGFYRITTEWAQPPQWKQVARIRPIENQFSVLFDPAAVRYDRQDAGYLFVDSVMSKDAYKRAYPNAKLAQSDFLDAERTNPAPDWLRIGPNKDNVRVAEYWLKEYRERELARLHNDYVCWLDELGSDERAGIIETRIERDWTIYQYILDGISVLYKTEWPLKLYPIIPVWGRQEIRRGKKFNVSVIRHAHDPQRLINLYVSNIAGAIGQQPKTPFIGPEGSFDANRQDWEEVNQIPKAFLEYVPKIVNGVALPPPQRQTYEPPVQALSLGLAQAVDATKAACGIFDPSLGNTSPDTSALAIQERNAQSDTGNYHFGDNESRSRQVAGVVLIQLIKKLDANEPNITVRSVDGKTKSVKLRRAVQHDDGSPVIHNLEEGQYDPHVVNGPGYTSARDQAFKIYSTLAHQDPTFMQIGGDIMFRNADWPGADELADRYEANLPQHLQKPGNPAQAQQKLMMAQQMITALSKQLHDVQNKLDAKLPDIEAKVEIAKLQEETKRLNLQLQSAIAEANLGYKGAMDELNLKIRAIETSMAHVQDTDNAEFDALVQRHAKLADMLDQQDTEAEADEGTEGGAA